MATNSADPFGSPWRLKQRSADPAGIDRAQRSKAGGREKSTRGQIKRGKGGETAI